MLQLFHLSLFESFFFFKIDWMRSTRKSYILRVESHRLERFFIPQEFRRDYLITDLLELRKLVKNFPDFPKRGIIYRDINPLIGDGQALAFMTEEFYRRFSASDPDAVAGIESRGFIIATSIAVRFGLGITMIRKAGKLPGKTTMEPYEIEYGTSVMEIQHGSFLNGQKVIVADDLIATGGTALAAAKLLEAEGVDICGFAFLIEISALKGGSNLRKLGYNTQSLLTF